MSCLMTKTILAAPETSPAPNRLREPYRVEILRTDEAFRALEPEWRDLYLETGRANPMLSYEWAAACRRHLCPEAALLVLAARTGGRLVGVAPLWIDRKYGARIVRFLGKGVTPYVGFLAARDHLDVESALLNELGRVPFEWDLLLLQQLAEPFTRLHCAPIPKSLRGVVEDVPWQGSAYVRWDGDWESLRAGGPGWLKREWRKVRRLEREGGGVRCYSGCEAVEQAGILQYVEDRSWKGRYGYPVSHRRSVNALMAETFETMAPRGEVQLWVARLREEPVAYAVSYKTPERLWLFRHSYQEQYAGLGAGVVLDLLAIRQAWDEGIREFDYLSGGEPYKADRTDAVRPLKQLILHSPTVRGYLAFALLIGPRRFMERYPKVRALLEHLALVRKCPRVLMPGSGVVRDRIH
jgi:CelD/BcsL family acetyltransferase involved in cellulose biosynthesis